MATKKLPTGIRMRGAKYLVDVTYKGQRCTATVDTLDEAVDQKMLLLQSMRTGKEIVKTRANAAGWTLAQALEKTLSLPKPEGWRGISYEKQATLNAEDALNFFGPLMLLSDITRDDIDAWFKDLERRGNSDSTINRKRSALSKLAKVAYTYDGLAVPLKLPKQRVEPVGRIRQISAAEEASLLTHLGVLSDDPTGDIVKVLIDTGMRCGELFNLRRDDIDVSSNVLLIHGTEGKGTKNGKIRSVPMTKRVKEIMGGYLSTRVTGGDFIVFPYDPSTFRSRWDRARSQMGLAGDKNFTPHVCRHTCASRLVRGGVSLAVVQQWLGHSNIMTTMRYAHLYPQDLMNAVKALEN